MLTRRSGDFEAAEDAVQEALLAAFRQWPADGLPENPRGWLVAVASRRLTDQIRSDAARRRRESEALPEPADVATPPPDEVEPDRDDTLTLLFLCSRHQQLQPAGPRHLGELD